ncbi:ABC transporter substrate-binding protein [Jeotgalibacillus proteolyticus]|uniref:ABC transporter substrate-binding protein n=1 Tax=Jeotgalibacillus proteolyticus TaxID=2082395 RepID=A0A2S5GA23_9BACL|nr:extracellular solute-binding protein [Jeotgalibacillus proteolyticus]PPA69840.1 ABC transporter substrate-binding protein [Jeotgalibacillus proteolyticus]
MKKFWSILGVGTLSLSLIACSDDSGDSAEGDSEDAVTIKVASWTFGTEEEMNLERLMLEEFEKEHPDIKVELDETIANDDWNGTLSAAASSGAMPDVFMLPSVPTALSNDWLMDLTDLTAEDEDFANIPEVVKETLTHNDQVVALPVAQHFLGYFVNKNLFNDANLDVPQYGTDIQSFTSAIKDVSDMSNGVAGTNHPFAIPDWYPSAANEELGWYTFNNGSYELDGQEFRDAIALSSDIISNKYGFETLTDEEKANFQGEDPEQVWQQSGVALKWDGTWGTADMLENLDFEWDFIGIPGGRTVIVNDYMGISKSSENAEAAYEFIKFMSFGEEGFSKRVEVAEREGKVLNSLPVTTNEAMLDEYFDMLEVPGVRLAYENLENGITEPVKIVPGFAQSRWEAPTGVAVEDNANANVTELIDAFTRGKLKLEDYSQQLDALAEQAYEDAASKLE